MASRLNILRELVALDNEYEMITGHPAYLHPSCVDGHAVFHFTGGVVADSPQGALDHMKELLRLAAEAFEREGGRND